MSYTPILCAKFYFIHILSLSLQFLTRLTRVILALLWGFFTIQSQPSLYLISYVSIFRPCSSLHPISLISDPASVFLCMLCKISFRHISSCTAQYVTPPSSLLHIGQYSIHCFSQRPQSPNFNFPPLCSSLGFPCAYEHQCICRSPSYFQIFHSDKTQYFAFSRLIIKTF